MRHLSTFMNFRLLVYANYHIWIYKSDVNFPINFTLFSPLQLYRYYINDYIFTHDAHIKRFFKTKKNQRHSQISQRQHPERATRNRTNTSDLETPIYDHVRNRIWTSFEIFTCRSHSHISFRISDNINENKYTFT